MSKKLLLLCFLVVIVMCVFNVEAATATIRPDGTGHYSSWIERGCPLFEWTCVDEDPVNTNDYLFTYSQNKKESFSFSDLSIPSQNGIGSITLHYVSKGMDDIKLANRIRPLIRMDYEDYFGEEIVLGTGDYSTYSVEYKFNPFTGEPWRNYYLDDIELGIDSSDSYNSGGKVMQMYATIEHGKPDLKTEITVQEFIDNGQVKSRVNATVRNDGISRASYFAVNLNYGGAQTYSVIDKLDSGEIEDYSFETDCSNGPFDFTLNADYYDNVDEIDESNNIQTVHVDCVI